MDHTQTQLPLAGESDYSIYLRFKRKSEASKKLSDVCSIPDYQ